jgi:hypothetical protein
MMGGGTVVADEVAAIGDVSSGGKGGQLARGVDSPSQDAIASTTTTYPDDVDVGYTDLARIFDTTMLGGRTIVADEVAAV